MIHKLPPALLLTILCFFKPAYANDSSLLINNAWIAEAPPVSKVMVAYMTIKNPSKDLITINKVESDLFSSIELHETIHENGLAKMKRYSKLDISANTSLQLKPGGLHLMLFNPNKRLKAGNTVNIRINTNDNTQQTIQIEVRKAKY